MPTLIDTREAFRRLRKEGGFTDEQADAIVDIFSDVDEQVVTRGDIEQLRTSLGGDIEQLRTTLEGDLQQLRTDMNAIEDRLAQQLQENRASTIRTVVASVAAVGAVLAVVIPLAIYLMG